MERALWAIQNSIFPLEKLFSHKFNFSDIALAFSKNLKRIKVSSRVYLYQNINEENGSNSWRRVRANKSI